jgi:hypothetical protein
VVERVNVTAPTAALGSLRLSTHLELDAASRAAADRHVEENIGVLGHGSE